MFGGPMAASQQRRESGPGPSDGPEKAGSLHPSDKSSSAHASERVHSGPSSTSKLSVRQHRNTIAVGDVDGRAFDILLR
jgi:hypothetical protein